MIFFSKNLVLSYIKTNLIFFTKLLKKKKKIYTKTDLVSFLMNQIPFFFFFYKNRSEFFLKKEYIHKIDLYELVLVKCVMYVQHIIHIMHKGYIGHQCLEDQTLSGQNGCHSVTQLSNLVLLDKQIYALSFFYFWVDFNYDPKHCKV